MEKTAKWICNIYSTQISKPKDVAKARSRQDISDIIWYTNGSKTDQRTGASVHSDITNLLFVILFKLHSFVF